MAVGAEGKLQLAGQTSPREHTAAKRVALKQTEMQLQPFLLPSRAWVQNTGSQAHTAHI